jgi:hypothetical protein
MGRIKFSYLITAVSVQLVFGILSPKMKIKHLNFLGVLFSRSFLSLFL